MELCTMRDYCCVETQFSRLILSMSSDSYSGKADFCLDYDKILEVNSGSRKLKLAF